MMEQKKLKEKTDEELKKQASGVNTLAVICIVAALLILVFTAIDLIKGKEPELTLIIIALCSAGGGVSLFPQIKEIRAELDRRNVI